jgi:hypothetical protein
LLEQAARGRQLAEVLPGDLAVTIAGLQASVPETC